MAKLVALEWDGREARIAVANARGNEAIVEDAFAIELAGAGTEDAALSNAEIGERLAQVLAERGLSGAEALVSLGRSNIELRTLTLPPAPPEEIPDMVRFQAMQAFTAIGEDWPLDFVELESDEESVNVLAAVVSPRQVSQIVSVCTAADLKPKCLVLRPFAAAALLSRGQLLVADGAALIVDLLGDSADLTAVSSGLVVFMRTVRLPATDDAAAQARAVVGEVRRTIGAAQNQMSGRSIEQIVVCGSAEEQAVLHQALVESLSLEVVFFDPFQAVRLGRTLKRQRPENSGRYAPLLGMLANEVDDARHAIDFLNPRKRPAPPSHARRNLLVAATLVTVVAGISLAVWGKLKQYDDEIAELETRAAAMETTVEAARDLIGKTDAVKEFTDGDITWLDEMREVALRLPDADHAILDEVLVQADVARGGSMILKGHVVSSDVIETFEDSLRFNDNTVVGRYGNIDRNRRDYPYTMDTTVIVAPDIDDRGRSKGRPYRDTIREGGQSTDKEPDVKEPDVKEPEPKEPEPKEPEPDAPDVKAPEPTQPESTKPAATEPEVTEPEVTEPEATEPEATEPEVTEPEVTEPEVTEPEATEPEAKVPEVPETDGESASPAAEPASEEQKSTDPTGGQIS